MLKKTILSTGLIAAGMLGTAGAANASVQTFSLAGFNAGDPSNTLNVSIVFTPNANGNLTIQINNTSNTLSDAEGVFGVEFELFNGLTQLNTSAPSIDSTAVVGYVWNVAEGSDHPPTYTATLSSGEYTNPNLTNPWVSSAVAGFYGINVGSGKPHDLVIGSTQNINASVYQHSPSLESGALFTLTGINGLTAGTTVEDVNVIYGTNSGDTGPLGSTPVPAGGPLPIPATLPLVGAGMLGLGLLALRNRRRCIAKP